MESNYRYYIKSIVAAALAVGSIFGSVAPVHVNASDPIEIGILQYVEHESLTANREGFIEGLKEAGYEDGANIHINYLNANADNANLQSMSEKLAKQNDYLFAIATPAAQSLANAAANKVPLYFSAVTDPVGANLVESLEHPGNNITGTIDAGPLKEQLELLIAIKPNIKTVGFIYNSGESNSVSEVEKAEVIAKEKGLEIVKKAVTSTNDIQQTMQSLIKEVDGIFLTTDNTLASSMNLVGDLAIEAKIPVVGGSIDMVNTNGLATYGLDYYELGKQTAKMLVDQIKNKTETQNIAVQSAKNLQLVINEKVANALGIDPTSIKISDK